MPGFCSFHVNRPRYWCIWIVKYGNTYLEKKKNQYNLLDIIWPKYMHNNNCVKFNNYCRNHDWSPNPAFFFLKRSDPHHTVLTTTIHQWFGDIKVSARVQDCPRTDRCSVFISRINPDKPCIFWNLSSSRLWLIPLKVSKSKEIAYLRFFLQKHMSV